MKNTEITNHAKHEQVDEKMKTHLILIKYQLDSFLAYFVCVWVGNINVETIALNMLLSPCDKHRQVSVTQHPLVVHKNNIQ